MSFLPDFLSPAAAAIAAAIAIPLLLLLYFLKLRRQERRIPSTLLWKKAVQDLQVNAPFQKLRKNLLLLLQLLILLAVLFSLGNPVANFKETSEERKVVLIDRSASMKTLEADGRTRLEHAKEAASTYVEDLAGESEIMVISFADRASVVSAFTSDERRLIRAIEKIEATDAPSRIGEALQLASAYSTKIVGRDGEGWSPDEVDTADVEIFSDGRLEDAHEEHSTRGNPTYHAVGRSSDNAGIVLFDVQRDIERPGIVMILAQVQNFGVAPMKADLSISVGERLMSVQEVALGPDVDPTSLPSARIDPNEVPSARNVIFELDHESGGVVKLELHRDDAFMLDNVVVAPVDPPRAVRVLAVSNRKDMRNVFTRAFQLSFEIEDFSLLTPSEYEEVSDDDLSVEGRSAFDLVVFDKHSTDRLPPGNYLFFGGVPKLPGYGIAEETVDEQLFVSWRETHPLLLNVTLDNTFTLGWKRLTLPAHAAPLIEGEDSTALGFVTDPGHRYVIGAFDLLESNFCMQPAFVMFLQNSLMFLATGGLDESGRLITPGETISVQVPPGAEEVRVTSPDGGEKDFDVAERHTFTFGRTHDRGRYKLAFDDAEETTEVFCANVLDSIESRVAPNPELAIGGSAVQSSNRESRVNRALWPYAVGLALLVLVFEWWIYNRRVMI